VRTDRHEDGRFMTPWGYQHCATWLFYFLVQSEFHENQPYTVYNCHNIGYAY
jgi:hypothetical protein